MRYFSGFGLQMDRIFFKEILDNSNYTIAGFSYGAQKAMQEAVSQVKNNQRVQKLQLISPAFFQHLKKEQIYKEIRAFTKNQDLYLKFFYKKICYPAKVDLHKFKKTPTLGELKELLLYQWKEEELRLLQDSGVIIEVYLGEQDKIIDTEKVKNFFQNYATIYSFKNAGHLLKE